MSDDSKPKPDDQKLKSPFPPDESPIILTPPSLSEETRAALAKLWERARLLDEQERPQRLRMMLDEFPELRDLPVTIKELIEGPRWRGVTISDEDLRAALEAE